MEIINISDYKDSDRFKELKSAIWKQAANGKPFGIKEQNANEYRYFHKFYEISKMLIEKRITKEQAAEMTNSDYQKFEFDQRLWEMYQFTVLECNDNAKRSENLRRDFAKCIDIKSAFLILAEIVTLLTSDKTILASAKLKAEVCDESTKPENTRAKRTRQG